MIFTQFMFFLAMYTSLLSANVIDLSLQQNSISILDKADVYIDKNNKHTFQYILKNNKKIFQSNKKDMLHLGYSEATVWIKFKIKNSSKEKITKVLEISNQMLDEVFLYVKQNNGYFIESKNGVLSSEHYSKSVLHMYFDISVEPKMVKEYYLRVTTSSCALYFKLNLLNKDNFYNKEIKHQLILTLFFGSIIALILYNLFIYLFTKDLAYLYYVLYLFFVVLEHLSYTILSKYIYPKNLFDIDAYLSIYYITFISIFGILFVREFLDIYKYKKLDFIYKVFLILDILFIIISSQELYPINLVVSLGMISLIYILFTNIYLFYHGNKNAKYMIVGWSIAIFGWVMQGNYNEGGWSLIYRYPYFFELSIFTEAILFSVALANKLNKTKELEKSVVINKILTKELHHRVKNNMQLIISIYRLKLSKLKNVSSPLREVEGAIQAIGTTHEMLSLNNISSNTNTKKYFMTLVNKLKDSYGFVNIDIKLHIHTKINTNHLIFVGIILNELMTNTFKYAFESKQGNISISLEKMNKKFIFIFEDNGKGYSPKNNQNSFGLELVKSLVESELKGKLDISFETGTKYIIKF